MMEKKGSYCCFGHMIFLVAFLDHDFGFLTMFVEIAEVLTPICCVYPR